MHRICYSRKSIDGKRGRALEYARQRKETKLQKMKGE
jgi:hypothetical protein